MGRKGRAQLSGFSGRTIGRMLQNQTATKHAAPPPKKGKKK